MTIINEWIGNLLLVCNLQKTWSVYLWVCVCVCYRDGWRLKPETRTWSLKLARSPTMESWLWAHRRWVRHALYMCGHTSVYRLTLTLLSPHRRQLEAEISDLVVLERHRWACCSLSPLRIDILSCASNTCFTLTLYFISELLNKLLLSSTVNTGQSGSN